MDLGRLRMVWVIAALWSTSLSARDVSVTTFNIKFYGNDRTAEAPQDNRDYYLKRFLSENRIDSDVFVFEEILDMDGLQRNVLGRDYRCVTYDHHSNGHQHVVLCHKRSLSFRIANDDNNYAYEDVAMSTLRPALHGILTDERGRDLAHIVGLHLKAMPDQSARRMSQADLLADNLVARDDNLPLIITGDLNTYEDDIYRIKDRLADRGVYISSVYNPYDFTFSNGRYENKFDWILTSPEVRVSERLRVDGPCNGDKGSDFDELDYYNDHISDHCPVTVTLDL